VLCVPEIADTLKRPEDLAGHVLLRSYRADEWPGWFAAAGVGPAPVAKGMMFDSSLVMMDAALQGAGVALAPPLMFARLLASGAIRQPFGAHVSRGSYWLTRLKSRVETPAMAVFRNWLLDMAKG